MLHVRLLSPSLQFAPFTLIAHREPCPAKAGDFFEFFAKIDIPRALSTCPGETFSLGGWRREG
jgi:hypothetical protein